MKRSGMMWVCLWMAIVGQPPRLIWAADRPVDFNRDVRPILSETCYQCHGPDAGKRKADLRLDTREGAFAERKGGPVLVAGKPEESELVARLRSDDPEEKMPPPGSGKALSASQVEILERWVREGAEWKGHWAYRPPVRSHAPGESTLDGRISLPPGFTRNDIDRFVLAMLVEKGLSPSAEADRVTLIRRLSFDLRGLPPTVAEVDQFVADSAPDAYEKLVDRMLASPQYGERMATLWLDLVRYADTTGYHGDNHRDVTLFRDYVIDAFNRNLAYDQFTIEQLAGDLLPNPSESQKIASGYNKLLMTTQEGGAQAREYTAKYAADRVRNASTVWMGSTFGCAECHDHKYDPFTMRDFYSFAAFFADIQEVAVGAQEAVKVPTPEQSARLQEIDAEIARLRSVLSTSTPALEREQESWEQTPGTPSTSWSVLTAEKAESRGGATLTVRGDGSIVASGASPEKDVYRLTFKLRAKRLTALRLEVKPDGSLPQTGPGRADNGNFVLSELTAEVNGKPVEWSASSATHAQAGFPVAGAVDGKNNTGWAILNEAGQPNRAAFETKEDFGAGDEAAEATLTVVLSFQYGSRHTLGRFRIAATDAARPVRDGGLPETVREALAKRRDERTDEQKTALATYYRTIAPSLQPTRDALAVAEKRRADVVASMPTTLMSRSGPPRMVRILPRGNWLDESGSEVVPAVPAFLRTRAFDTQARATRLDLARWLVARDNPLTSRVFVNRLWALAFGQGIVGTADDFGAQGTLPTHPELLDWLAVEFMDSGWNVKKLLRLIVTSGTYRQSSRATEFLHQRDPYNQWLARQGRFRLDAEFVRDTALAVSGLLVPHVGGPNARPYQPAGYWSHLNFPRREYQADHGDGLYRRGLYTYWCRTFLHPSLLAFDAPTREECTVRRARSNTPLQALVLLNDPIYVEAARALAERVLSEGGDDDASRFGWLYRTVLSRLPRSGEPAVLQSVLEKHRAQYRADPASADALVHVGERPVSASLDVAELAAWTSIARVVLNLHETITRN